MNLVMCLFLCLLFLCLFLCLFVCMFLCFFFFVCLFLCLSVCFYVCLFLSLLVCFFVIVFFFIVSLSVYLFACFIFQFNLLDSSQGQPSAEQRLEDVWEMFVKINVEVVKLRGRNLENCVSLFDQRPHHRNVLELFGVGRGRKVDRGRCRC